MSEAAAGNPWITSPYGLGPGADILPASGHAQKTLLRSGHSGIRIPQDLARADMNVVLPLHHVRDLIRQRLLAGLSPRVFSIAGYRTRAHDVAEETATRIAASMVEGGVNLALIVPV